MAKFHSSYSYQVSGKLKIKVSLCTPKRHAGIRISITIRTLILVPDGMVDWTPSRPGCCDSAGKNPRCPVNRRLNGLQSESKCAVQEKKSLNPTVNRITRFRPVSCKLDTLPTELNRLFEIYVKTENTHGVLPLSNDSLYEG